MTSRASSETLRILRTPPTAAAPDPGFSFDKILN
jgi:hypothetical protein